jgi:hypothetical protein
LNKADKLDLPDFIGISLEGVGPWSVKQRGDVEVDLNIPCRGRRLPLDPIRFVVSNPSIA